MKIYILIYSGSMGGLEDVSGFLDSIPEVYDWCSDMPRSIFVKTILSARQLGDKLHERFPRQRYLINRVAKDRWGWLPKSSWNMFKEDEMYGERE